jgi:hypothetical protein
MKRLLLSSLVLLVASNFCAAESKDKLYGKAPTVKEPTAISALNAEPTKYKDQTVLLSGKIVDVCKGVGCWVEVESADSARVICRSLDESIHFPKDVVGKIIQVQGKVLYDVKAPGTKTEKHEGGVAHACPAPQVLVSIEGATVADLAEVTPAPEAEPKKE